MRCNCRRRRLEVENGDAAREGGSYAGRDVADDAVQEGTSTVDEEAIQEENGRCVCIILNDVEGSVRCGRKKDVL